MSVSDAAIGPLSEADLTHRIAAIRELKTTRRPMRLATIGELNVPYKAQADVIRALPALNRMGIPCEYHLIGGGDATRLESLAKSLGLSSQVITHGTVPHAEVFPLLKRMDLYVHPSRTEGLPRAVIEAFSVAIPVIGSAVGGIPELLPPERLFKSGAISQIVDFIRTMQSEQELLKDAQRNWKRAHDFQAEILEARRTEFFKTFQQTATTSGI